MTNRVMVAGAGLSGLAAARLCIEKGREVFLYDSNENLDTERVQEGFSREEWRKIFLKKGVLLSQDLEGISLCVISPGIDLETPFVGLLKAKGIPLWSEIELAFSVAKGKLAAITGTNGKTTTTALTGEILQAFFPSVFTVGNIGIPYTSIAAKTKEESVTVLEASSFQLETIHDFHPRVCAILNITPDHLNRHHTMENYIRMKENIAKNQGKEDVCVLNYEDGVLREFGEKHCPGQVVFFSSKRELQGGYFLLDEKIYFRQGEETREVLDTKKLQILGRHNHENVMAAAAIAHALCVPWDVIREACYGFQAVPHRIEYVDTKDGVAYYNDSKGTNPDASIQAVQAMPGATYLIAGGYDKGSIYDQWVESFQGKVKGLVLLGQTGEAIAACAKKHGLTSISFARDMPEAVRLCAEMAKQGEYVLLSPACASWGMFKNYEERGDIFKASVRAL